VTMCQRGINHSWRLWHSVVCDVYLGWKGRHRINIAGFQAFSLDDSSVATAKLSTSKHKGQLYLILQNLFTGDINNCHMGGQKLLPHLLMLIITYIQFVKPK